MAATLMEVLIMLIIVLRKGFTLDWELVNREDNANFKCILQL